jgi:hypothetical protein
VRKYANFSFTFGERLYATSFQLESCAAYLVERHPHLREATGKMRALSAEILEITGGSRSLTGSYRRRARTYAALRRGAHIDGVWESTINQLVAKRFVKRQ